MRKILEIIPAGGFCVALWFAGAVGAYPAVPSFQLRDTGGAVHTPAEWRTQKAVLLFFVTTDCPVANSYVPEFNRIREAYSGRGVLIYAVQADTTVQ
jgi:peroxiredoxin